MVCPCVYLSAWGIVLHLSGGVLEAPGERQKYPKQQRRRRHRDSVWDDDTIIVVDDVV